MELLILSISVLAIILIITVPINYVRRSRNGSSQSDSSFIYFDSGSTGGDSIDNNGNDCAIDGSGDFGGDCGGGDGGGGGD